MKNYQKIILVVTAVILAACSDGQLSKAAANPGENTPIPVLINAFKVADASDAQAKADKTATIDAGGSVMVSWDVTGAKGLEIVDSKGKKLSKVEGLVGKTQSEPLMADERFTLTAEGPDGVKAQAVATVAIRKKEIKITTFTADPDKINVGQSTRLCWVVSDASAKVSVKAGDEEIYSSDAAPITPPADQPQVDLPQPPADGYAQAPTVTMTSATKALRFLLKGDTPVAPPADGVAAAADAPTVDAPKTDVPPAEAQEVCPVTHAPAQSTTYTLSVMDGDTVAATQDVKVEVAPTTTQIDITFVAQPAQLPGPGDVTLTWRVQPSDATVTIDHGVPTDGKAEGVATVNVTETTTYTLTATTKDGQSRTKTVTVTLPSTIGRGVVIQALTPSIFAGETAKISITQGNASGSVKVLDGSGRGSVVTPTANVVSISNPPEGDNLYTLEIDGVVSNSVKVEVHNLVRRSSAGAYGVAFSGTGKQNVVAGSDSGGIEEKKEDGATKYELNVGLTTLLDMETVVERKFNISPDLVKRVNPDFGKSGQLKFFAPYPVSAIAADRKDPKRVFFGTTGALFASSDSGKSWQLVDPLPIFDNAHKNSSPEQHAGCGGSVQKGVAYDEANGALVNFIQVCDIIVDGKSAVLATDQGTFHVSDVDARLDAAKRKANPWQAGIVGKVVNKLATAKSGDSTVFVAAASDGVYVNAKNGDPKEWKQIDAKGMKDPVNTVAVVGSTIYAGTDAGLFKSNGMDATSSTFTQVSSATDKVAVKALATDAADPATLYVGTDKGLKISRDCAGSFTDVAAEVGKVRNIATSAGRGRSAVVLTSENGLFTSVGVAGTPGACAPPADSKPIAIDKPATGQQPAAGTGPGTVVP